MPVKANAHATGTDMPRGAPLARPRRRKPFGTVGNDETDASAAPTHASYTRSRRPILRHPPHRPRKPSVVCITAAEKERERASARAHRRRRPQRPSPRAAALRRASRRAWCATTSDARAKPAVLAHPHVRHSPCARAQPQAPRHRLPSAVGPSCARLLVRTPRPPPLYVPSLPTAPRAVTPVAAACGSAQRRSPPHHREAHAEQDDKSGSRLVVRLSGGCASV